MSKEASNILAPLWFYAKRHPPSNKEVCVVNYESALIAMDEYAKEVAIAFAKDYNKGVDDRFDVRYDHFIQKLNTQQ